MSQSDRIRSAYAQIASNYARHNAEMPAELIALGEDFMSLLPPPRRVLDVGCGAGRDMAWFERQGIQVTGIDLTPEMLAEAGRKVKGELLEMDMRKLEFQDGSFDGIWCIASLLHLPKDDAPTTLAEMHRVLVPGGMLALYIHEGKGEGWEPVPYMQSVQRFFARYQMPEALDMMHDAGFEVLQSGMNSNGRTWLWFLAWKPTVTHVTCL